MNIGGIKVGSVEIERVCNLVEEIQETAAIAVSGPNGGPSRLGKLCLFDNTGVVFNHWFAHSSVFQSFM
jgi:acyl-coenzyme A synthetase/AMP-(fatty) acid ligase